MHSATMPATFVVRNLDKMCQVCCGPMPRVLKVALKRGEKLTWEGMP